MEILIVGGNGGIGLAMVQEAAVRFPQARVHATYRKQQPDWQHPNVVWLHEIIDDPGKDHLYLVTDYHCGGSLGDKVESRNAIYEDHNIECHADGRPQDVVRW